jgi:hypothetical protein
VAVAVAMAASTTTTADEAADARVVFGVCAPALA